MNNREILGIDKEMLEVVVQISIIIEIIIILSMLIYFL
jgi:hypothetical protein